MPKRLSSILIFISIAIMSEGINPVLSFDSGECFDAFQRGMLGQEGGVDRHGRPVSNISEAFGFTYKFCVEKCGSESKAFNASLFLQRTGTWLLPPIALLSNLPYDFEGKGGNFMSVVHTVGSPTLATYSVTLTALNANWISGFFSHHTAPVGYTVIEEVMTSLQQAPLDVRSADLGPFVRSQVWWEELHQRLDYDSTSSIPARWLLLWVFLAYLFTVIDAFHNLPARPSPNGISDGLATGTVWLWLLAIAVGWLFLSPKCDSKRLKAALDAANNRVTPDEQMHAVTFRPKATAIARMNSQWTPATFNYARALPWARAVLDVRDALEVRRALEDGSGFWRYMLASVVAAVFAVLLPWGTTGGAVLILSLTPTVGLGCRSLTFLLYAAVSTTVWLLLVLSSLLAEVSRRRQNMVAGFLASVFWLAGTVLVFLNAVGILAACLLQFSNIYDNCYCNSHVLGLGRNAYDIILVDGSDVKKPWAGGVALSCLCVFLHMVFIWLLK